MLEANREPDLHILRQLKFVSVVVELCKMIGMVHKKEVEELLGVID